MGTFTVGFLLKNHVHREKSVRVPHLIGDAGSEATWIPRKELAKADIKPETCWDLKALQSAQQ